ncbi:hypothetical protein KKG24_01360 [Patescibacteria group bacterium]|nr:hypothetical protein [Patescibacteria group bacterium]
MENTALDHLIAFLLSARSTRIYRKILWVRMQARQKSMNAGSFNQHIYRLHKKGIIESRDGKIHIHRENLLKFSAKNNSMKNSVMKSIFPTKTEKILISFDIPEKKKKTRDWLRNQIKYWDFEMIHKSLWLGYGPLPKEFNDRLKQLGIEKNVRIFKIKKVT